MFMTRRSLPRRTFLRGMGVSLALPLLDAMVPALTAQSRTAAAPSSSISMKSACGSITTPLPMAHETCECRIPDGRRRRII